MLGGCVTVKLSRHLAINENGKRHHSLFEQTLNLIGLYRPTTGQVRALCREMLLPDKVAVVVGGNSITHGVGQRASEMWTHKLQETLGDGYGVINLALQGNYPVEFGGTAAEFLSRDHAKVIYITLTGPGGGGDPDGLNYRYFFWDAYYKGWLLRDPVRDARLRQLEKARKPEGKGNELKLEARLDQRMHYNDLWTNFTYNCCATVWTIHTAQSFTRPRGKYEDVDSTALPFEARHPIGYQKAIMDQIHDLATAGHVRSFGPDNPPAPKTGTDRIDPERAPLVQDLRACFPPPFRKRTLLLIVDVSPLYVNRLPAAEQASYHALNTNLVRVLEDGGFPALEIGQDYGPDDFYDPVHISEAGGRKMAQTVASKVRRMAEELDYVPRTSEPGGSPRSTTP